ncbi:hypothetical protein KCP78_15625 [Salmonella enterica subsp. enterica]|nr:hypothetical protein KCP78_15625 [Salmonella enterica subsp. enterica]
MSHLLRHRGNQHPAAICGVAGTKIWTKLKNAAERLSWNCVWKGLRPCGIGLQGAAASLSDGRTYRIHSRVTLPVLAWLGAIFGAVVAFGKAARAGRGRWREPGGAGQWRATGFARGVQLALTPPAMTRP